MTYFLRLSLDFTSRLRSTLSIDKKNKILLLFTLRARSITYRIYFLEKWRSNDYLNISTLKSICSSNFKILRLLVHNFMKIKIYLITLFYECHIKNLIRNQVLQNRQLIELRF